MLTESVSLRFTVALDGEGRPLATLFREGGPPLTVTQAGGYLIVGTLLDGDAYDLRLSAVAAPERPRREVELSCVFVGDAPREPGQRYAILQPPGFNDPAAEVRVEGEALVKLLRQGKRLRITVEEMGDA